MKKILFTFLITLFFSLSCFAASSDYIETEDGMNNRNPGRSSPGADSELRNTMFDHAVWLTLNGQGITGLSAQSPLIVDKGFYYALGATFGGNFSKYMGIQGVVSFIPPVDKKKSTELLLDFMLVIQKDVQILSSGFRPYLGFGLATEYSFSPDTSGFIGYGLATEAGLRYFHGKFLAGLGVNYNYYWVSFYGDDHVDDFEAFHSNIRFGLSVGCIF